MSFSLLAFDTYHDEFMRVLSALLIAVLIAGYGYSKQSLSLSGALAAVGVGTLTFFVQVKFGLVLILFFFTSSRITKIGSEKKKILEHDFVVGGQRDYSQVFSNSFAGVVACILYYYHFGHDVVDCKFGVFLSGMLLGHYACCAGDTWSSELGILSSTPPFLITSFSIVPPGTNGGVSIVGLLASVLGGTCIGLVYFLHDWHYSSIFVGAISGLLGSLIDSLLGATLQYSAFDTESKKVIGFAKKNAVHICGMNVLSNGQVNFVSSLIMSIVAGYIAIKLEVQKN